MKRIGKSILALAIALVACSTSCFAIGTAERRAARAPDVFRLCRSEIPNIDRIIACLKRERPNLSKSCGAVMGELRTSGATESDSPFIPGARPSRGW